MHASSATVYDLDRARDLIEVGLRRHPTCRECGLPTTVAERPDGLWIVCSALELQRPGPSLLRRVIAGSLLHDRHLLVDRPAA